jgi:glycerol kinase
MTVNDLLMQFQADILGVDVVRPKMTETTALGAAYGAGLAAGLWSGLDEIADLWAEDARWSPAMGDHERTRLHNRWEQAVQRSLGWV